MLDDGAVLIVLADGGTKEVLGDGVLIVLADGGTKEVLGDGAVLIVLADGGTKEVLDDGGAKSRVGRLRSIDSVGRWWSIISVS